MIKESYNLIDERHTWPFPTKSGSLRSYIPLVIIPTQKIREIIWFFSVILLIKESWNLTAQEKRLGTSNQNW